jgi:hypothetical protein
MISGLKGPEITSRIRSKCAMTSLRDSNKDTQFIHQELAFADSRR